MTTTAMRTISPWQRFLVRRLAGLVGIFASLVVVTFFIVAALPGDPARSIAGPDATADRIEQVRHQLGLDQSLGHRFLAYVTDLLHGNLGTSFTGGDSVSSVIATRLPFTAQLPLITIIVVFLLSVPIGMSVAVACRSGNRQWLDGVFTLVTGFVGAVPEFVLATVLIVIFAIKLRILPAAGADTASALVLPIIALSLGPTCALARVVRRETSTVLAQDYLRTARGKRLGTMRLYLRHTLPNLLASTLTLGGVILTSLLGGTVLIEFVFNWPGLGSRVVQAVVARDYPVIQGSVLVLGMLAALLNLLVDVGLGLLDPRTLAAKVADQ